MPVLGSTGVAINAATVTTKGDTLAATGAAAVSRVGVGADGTVLTADSTQTAGVKWGTPALQSLRDTYLRPSVALAETIPRAPVTTSATPTSGTLWLAPIALSAGTVISRIAWASVFNAAASPTHWWFGLYNSSFVQLATTADQTTTAWAAQTVKELSIATVASGAASTFTTTYTGLHYLGFLMTASTVVDMAHGATGAALMITPRGGASSTGQTTPPAFPFTAATPSGTTNPVFPYAYVG